MEEAVMSYSYSWAVTVTVTEAVENYVRARFYILFESMDLHFKIMLSLSNNKINSGKDENCQGYFD